MVGTPSIVYCDSNSYSPSSFEAFYIIVFFAHQMAHGPLSRTNTAPTFLARAAGDITPTPLTQSMSMSSTSSQYPGSSAYPSSTSISSSTTATSTSTLNGGPVIPTDNIINQRADPTRSLYQICVTLRQRLAEVPGFEQHLQDLDEEDDEDDTSDPVSSMWRCLRKGFPLMTIYNTLKPEQPLEIDTTNVAPAKRATRF